MELFAESVLFDYSYERLIQFHFVNPIHFDEELLDYSLVNDFFVISIFENCEEFDLGDRLVCKNRILSCQSVDRINISDILSSLLSQFFRKEVNTGIAMKLYIKVFKTMFV